MSGIKASDTRYRIGPGDMLDIRVFNRPQFSLDGVRVDSSGMIRMPLIENEIQAVCQTEGELAKEISTRYARYYKNLQVDVFIKEYHSKQVAIIGAVKNVTRPENLRMKHLLDIHVETVSSDDFAKFDRVATVDVQPHYFGGTLERADLVVDHHPEQANHNAVFKDIRPDYGSTCTILTEHLRAVDMDISERAATAMLYAIKSDTLFFQRHANRADIEAFSYLYPLGDATMIRKMEGAEITAERLDYLIKAWQQGRMMEHVFCAFLGEPPREDFIPYVADFYLQLENVQWTVICGVVNDQFVVSVRNLGYSRNAGDFVRRWFADIGSAGGHRTMAKAVVPVEAFQKKFGTYEGSRINQSMLELVLAFLHEAKEKKATTEPDRDR